MTKYLSITIAIIFLFSCSNDEAIDSNNEAIDSNDETIGSNTNHELLLDSFYNENGGRSSFSQNQLLALETLILSQEDIEAGRLNEAKTRIDNIFSELPLSSTQWSNISSNSTCTDCSINIGRPIAYSGLRMLKQIVDLGIPESTKSLTMTAVVAPCAQVSRPTPSLTPETVNLNIAPEILADNSHVLKVSTELFRKWVQAITGGVKINLVVHTLDECTTVDYTDDGRYIVSYPDRQSMVNAVPDDIASETDFWWVIAPSGVPGDGSGYGIEFITGGMASYGAGLPLFISDDAWFIRKPEHLGTGAYHEIELRAYQPQWFQHEFMHHLFRKWPEFKLEESGHQWFDRSTWPADFQGKWESDYYSESITKRLLNASPSLAEGLKAPDYVNFGLNDLSILLGKYQRQPVENEWHDVEIVMNGDSLIWLNAAGVSWSLKIIDGDLWTGADCPYGEQKILAELGSNQEITAVNFNGVPYKRIN